MKIISANRSEVFDEYINIISRYNDKSLVKQATGFAGTAREAARDIERLSGKGAAELAQELAAGSARASSIAAERFGRAGVTGVEQMSKIFSLADEILKKDKYVIEELGKIRRATPDELKAINEWVAANPGKSITGSGIEFNKGIGNGTRNFKSVKTATTEVKAVDFAKEIETGTHFTNNEAMEFRKITSEVIGEPPVRPTDAPTVRPPDAPPVRPPDAPPVRPPDAPTRSISDMERIRRSVARGIVENRAAKKAILESIEELGTSLSRAIREGQTELAEQLTRQIDEYFQKFDDLLKSEVATIRETNERLLNEVKEQLAEAIRTGDDRVISELTGKLSAIEAKMTEDLASIKGSVETINNTLAANAEASAQASRELSGKIASQSDQITEMKRTVDEFRVKLEELKVNTSAARGAVDSSASAAGAVGKATALSNAKKYLGNALKIAIGLGAGYLAYKWYTSSGEEESEEDASGGSETIRAGGGSGEEDVLLGGDSISPDTAAALEDPQSRKTLFDKISQMRPADREKILNKIGKYYYKGAFFQFEDLGDGVVINNERIRYVFVYRMAGGDLSPIRTKTTVPYFLDVYNNPGEKKNALIIVRMESQAPSSDPQRLANYSFSVMANTGMFAGNIFGNRGARFGRGKAISSRPEVGLAGAGKKKMTRKEKRMALERARELSVESEADDILFNNLEDYLYDDMDDIDDPMDVFASGQEEYFTKISKNVNISTNKTNSYEFAKKADKISNRYFKDAVEDLQDDEFMKAYYAGFSKLHNQKPKKQKPDYEKLYDLHDETGAELIHKAHPKAISVAEAIGNGGLVENESEKSKAMEDVAFRVPSGNYRARYAFIQNALKKKS